MGLLGLLKRKALVRWTLITCVSVSALKLTGDEVSPMLFEPAGTPVYYRTPNRGYVSRFQPAQRASYPPPAARPYQTAPRPGAIMQVQATGPAWQGNQAYAGGSGRAPMMASRPGVARAPAAAYPVAPQYAGPTTSLQSEPKSLWGMWRGKNRNARTQVATIRQAPTGYVSSQVTTPMPEQHQVSKTWQTQVPAETVPGIQSAVSSVPCKTCKPTQMSTVTTQPTAVATADEHETVPPTKPADEGTLIAVDPVPSTPAVSRPYVNVVPTKVPEDKTPVKGPKVAVVHQEPKPTVKAAPKKVDVTATAEKLARDAKDLVKTPTGPSVLVLPKVPLADEEPKSDNSHSPFAASVSVPAVVGPKVAEVTPPVATPKAEETKRPPVVIPDKVVDKYRTDFKRWK